jgi:hypothetical protein
MLQNQSRPPAEYIDTPGMSYLVTGIFTEADIIESYAGKVVLVGIVKNDQMGRFQDGSRIHTSAIVKEIAPDVFLTRSENVYRVESWRETSKRAVQTESVAP